MNASERYNRTLQDYREAAKKPDVQERVKQGQKLREAALERADRREWAHKRRGTETRWAE